MNRQRRHALTTAALTLALPSTWAQEFTLKRKTMHVSDGVALSLLYAPSPATTDTTFFFLPGWGMPASLWEDNMRALARYAPCVALDPRGQGESQAPEHGYTLQRRTADLHEALGSLKRVVLVAWSLGVLEALHYVHTHGEAKLAALVLVDNSVGEPPAPKAGDFVQRLRANRKATMDRFVRGLFATAQPEARIEAIKRSALKPTLEQSIALLSYPMPREHWSRIARALKAPLSYLVTPRFAQQAQSLKAARPGTRVEVFETAGHALFVDAPLRFNAVLLEVLREVG